MTTPFWLQRNSQRCYRQDSLKWLTLAILFLNSLLLAQNNSLPKGWQEIRPGGETICSRGEPFVFYVYKGNPDKVVIDFSGGGACWNEENCSEDSKTFEPNVNYIRDYAKNGFQGIYKKDEPANPLKDWTHIIIPYCTGDIHWGNKTSTYVRENGETFTIQHKGAINAKSVINWTKENFTDPRKLFITGCSAGAYGSIFWTPYIKEKFKLSQIKQFGDGGVGISNKEFLEKSSQTWGYMGEGPVWINKYQSYIDSHSIPQLTDFYQLVNTAYPDLRTAQFTTAFDGVQMFYYEQLDGNPDEWPTQMVNSLTSIAQNSKNFNYFIAPGFEHCVLPFKEFYQMKNDDIKLTDWIDSYVNDKNLKNVNCTHDCDKSTIMP